MRLLVRALPSVLLVLITANVGGDTGPPARSIALVGGTVIDGTDRPPRRATIVVQGERISAVVPPQSPLPPGATIVDVSGRTLIPGLVDTHLEWIQAKEPASRAQALGALLDAGVTTVRVFGEDTHELIATRDAVRAGAIAGPRIVISGPRIDANDNWDEKRLQEALRDQPRSARFVVLGPDTPPALTALAVKQARGGGRSVTGALRRTTWTKAARAHVNLLEGPAPWSDFYLAPHHREAFRRRLSREGLRSAQVQWLESVDLDSEEIARLVRWLRRGEVFVEPRLEHFARGLPPETRPGRGVWPTLLALVYRYHSGGVRLVAGSGADSNLHAELLRLAATGIPPGELIQIATRNGADALGYSDAVGTLEVGKVADIVVLASSPLVDIAHSRDIERVYVRGQEWHTKESSGPGPSDECPTTTHVAEVR